MLASLSIGHAVRPMPVAETISILNFTLILVMILVVPLMEEQVSPVN